MEVPIKFAQDNETEELKSHLDGEILEIGSKLMLMTNR